MSRSGRDELVPPRLGRMFDAGIVSWTPDWEACLSQPLAEETRLLLRTAIPNRPTPSRMMADGSGTSVDVKLDDPPMSKGGGGGGGGGGVYLKVRKREDTGNCLRL